MLSPQLRRKVHALWSDFWSSGLSNPLVAIEQITYLLFIRQLEALNRDRVTAGKPSIYSLTDEEAKAYQAEQAAIKKGTIKAADAKAPKDYERCKWSYISQNPSFPLLNDHVFPWLRSLDSRITNKDNGNTTLGRISGRLSDAYFILDVNKTEMLKRAVKAIDDLFRQIDTRSVNADIMGDIFEYLLEEVKESGKNGQFRTPRHTIRFMAQMLNPELGKLVLDPACGSGGFLLNSLLHWRATHSDQESLRIEWDGTIHGANPVWPKGKKLDQQMSRLFWGYDNDRTMVRIAWMNLILHGLDTPEIHQRDALSKRLDTDEHGKDKPQSGTYDYILANPPFTGSVDEGDLSDHPGRFPRGKGSNAITTKSELLFVWLMLDLLKVGGRTAVIVPDGVLFGGTGAHVALRKKLLFDNTLEAVISLPANMFQPYSGVKTSILIFQKIGERPPTGADPRTSRVWFYEVSDEAYSLDQKRKERFGQDNDLWDCIEKFKAWRNGDDEAATSKVYHQPTYWEERWRVVDARIEEETGNPAGHTLPLHAIWPDDFPFDPTDERGARQYEDALLARLGPQMLGIFQREAHAAAVAASEGKRKADPAKLQAAADKQVKAIIKVVNKAIKETDVLDREDDQFGVSACKALLKQAGNEIEAWLATLPAKAKEPDADGAAAEIIALLPEFAKLDGYNIWRRSQQLQQYPGKRGVEADGKPIRVPTQMSWIVPVRVWAEHESWGIDPTTEKPIAKSTHVKGAVDPAYIDWLRDTCRAFDDNGLVKDAFRDRLHPDCLEALDLNLSAGRHKPFEFDAGTHEDPAELIQELQGLHGQVQERLAKLLLMVGGGE